MTQPKYDLDKAMASVAARSIIQCILDHKQQTYNFSAAAVQLRAAARVQTVEEADRALADYLVFVMCEPATHLEDEPTYSSAIALHTRQLAKACREARAREAAEREGTGQ